MGKIVDLDAHRPVEAERTLTLTVRGSDDDFLDALLEFVRQHREGDQMEWLNFTDFHYQDASGKADGAFLLRYVTATPN
jgi:hypothetical protein